MFFALAALAVAVATPASPASGKYLIHATVSQDGKVLYQPRLTTKAGEAGAVVMLDGKTNYALKVVASPDAAQKFNADGVSLALDLVVGGVEHNRRLATTVVLKSGEPFTLTLPATASDPAVTVDVAVDKV